MVEPLNSSLIPSLDPANDPSPSGPGLFGEIGYGVLEYKGRQYAARLLDTDATLQAQTDAERTSCLYRLPQSSSSQGLIAKAIEVGARLPALINPMTWPAMAYGCAEGLKLRGKSSIERSAEQGVRAGVTRHVAVKILTSPTLLQRIAEAGGALDGSWRSVMMPFYHAHELGDFAGREIGRLVVHQYDGEHREGGKEDLAAGTLGLGLKAYTVYKMGEALSIPLLGLSGPAALVGMPLELSMQARSGGLLGIGPAIQMVQTPGYRMRGLGVLATSYGLHRLAFGAVSTVGTLAAAYPAGCLAAAALGTAAIASTPTGMQWLKGGIKTAMETLSSWSPLPKTAYPDIQTTDSI